VSDTSIQWQLVNPEGAARVVAVQPAARLAALEGKTIGLSWNGKPGGDIALDEIAALLSQRHPGVRFIRCWEAVPESVAQRELSTEVIQAVANLQPDAVIVAQAD